MGKDRVLLRRVRKVSKMAGPAIFENVMMMLTSFINTAMVGALGAVATAAVAVNTNVILMLNSLVQGISIGVTALVARYVGANDPKSVRQAAPQCFVAVMAIGVTIWVLALILCRFVPVWMGAQADVVPQATSYFFFIALGLLPYYLGLTLSALLRGAGDTRSPMRAVFIGEIAHVALNAFFIYPTRPVAIGPLNFMMPGLNLGAAGAAAATSIGYLVFALVLVKACWKDDGLIHFRPSKHFKLDWPIIQRMLHIGIPSMLERLVITGGSMFYMRLVTGLGTVPLAAHHLAVQAEAMSYQPAYGFAIAATTLVGQSLGADDKDAAKSYGNINAGLSLIIHILFALALLLIPDKLIAIFTPDAEVVALGAQVLRVVAIAQPFYAGSIVLTGALRGAGDTKAPLYIAVFTMCGIRLMVAWFFAYHLNMGLIGAWYGMVTDIVLRGSSVVFRWTKGKWQNIDV